MRIIFMGTPDFAVPSLEKLCSMGHDVCAVFTRTDKKVGRGMKTRFSPVKQRAVELGIPVYQPEMFRSEENYSLIASLKPELIVVVAYGVLLPERVLDLPEKGCVNIHGSLLPAYRGAAPVQWAVLNGEKETGVTAMYMAPKLDSGDIIDVIKTPIGEDEDADTLYHRLAGVGAELLERTVAAIENGSACAVAQDDSLATWASPLTKEMGDVDFTRPAKEICCQIRGLQPWPAAKAVLNGKSYKLYAAEPAGDTDAAPGTVLGNDKKGLYVAAGDRALLIKELQAEGGKRMRAADYLRGHRV